MAIRLPAPAADAAGRCSAKLDSRCPGRPRGGPLPVLPQLRDAVPEADRREQVAHPVGGIGGLGGGDPGAGDVRET